jgi:hypothetical protein
MIKCTGFSAVSGAPGTVVHLGRVRKTVAIQTATAQVGFRIGNESAPGWPRFCFILKKLNSHNL